MTTEHFEHGSYDDFYALAFDESDLLKKLDSEEAIRVLFAFSLRDRLIRPVAEGNRATIAADSGQMTVEVNLPDARRETVTLDLAAACEWDELGPYDFVGNAAGAMAHGYAKAMLAALEAANEVAPRSRLP